MHVHCKGLVMDQRVYANLGVRVMDQGEIVTTELRPGILRCQPDDVRPFCVGAHTARTRRCVASSMVSPSRMRMAESPSGERCMEGNSEL